MQEIKLPYQNHVNKIVCDYMLSCCEQLNNVNFASTTEDKEANELNYIYLLLQNSSIYLFTAFSLREGNIIEKDKETQTFNYNSLLDIWVKLKDINIFCDNENIKNSEDTRIYKFNIKKFYSTLSFKSSYQDRQIISLLVKENTLDYVVSKSIVVTLANEINSKSKLYEKIINSFTNNYTIDKNTFVMSVDSVDKNSFLLPYFNHKDCLNFSVSSDSNVSYLCNVNNCNYIINTLIECNKLYYQSLVKLRKDKFNCFNTEDNIVNISPGLWQILVMLQNNKQWKELQVYTTCATLIFKIKDVEIQVHHVFNKKAIYLNQTLQLDLNKYKFIGKVKASEVFLFNKLFTDPKNSYFDFSLQQFLGSNYVFKDEKDTEEYKATDFETQYPCEIPLTISLAELKHYIGGDLSQKDFILCFYTDGINVMIERWNSKETEIEVQIIFNHQVSKQYLGL